MYTNIDKDVYIHNVIMPELLLVRMTELHTNIFPQLLLKYRSIMFTMVVCTAI